MCFILHYKTVTERKQNLYFSTIPGISLSWNEERKTIITLIIDIFTIGQEQAAAYCKSDE